MTIYRFALDPSYLFTWLAGLAEEDRHLSIINKVRHYADRHLAELFSAEEQLKDRTVYSFLESCHEKLTNQLKNRFPALLKKLARELQRTGEVACADQAFSADVENAMDCLAIHDILGHGTSNAVSGTGHTGGRQKRFLLDFSAGADLYSDYEGPQVDPYVFSSFLHGYPALVLRGNEPPSELKCHLCDSLLDVYQRVTHVRGKQPTDLFDEDNNVTCSLEAIMITARLSSVVAFRLAKDRLDSSTIAENSLLSPIARRRGLAIPIVSAAVPCDLWSVFPTPVRDFVLDAAEVVGADRCPPLVPMPSRLSVEEEVKRMQEASDPFESPAATREDLLLAWKQLRQTEATLDIFYAKDIERSLAEKPVLQLQPLHKRVLGLLEAMIGRRLKTTWLDRHGRTTNGHIAERWRMTFLYQSDLSPKTLPPPDTLGFKGHQHRQAPCGVDRNDDPVATLESEAGWLIHASRKHGSSAHCKLSEILDEIVKEILTRVGTSQTDVSLVPSSPAAQAKALAIIASPTSEGRRLLLYLGNIVITLRNFIEHGIDERTQQGLLVENADCWANCPGRGDLLKWNRNRAKGVRWS
ncbi:MAG TPA: hypothetical protein VFI31_10500, partial [Pirellulales bacterium]|nr:hypothetical protein [Pirellulales bacterium]